MLNSKTTIPTCAVPCNMCCMRIGRLSANANAIRPMFMETPHDMPMRFRKMGEMRNMLYRIVCMNKKRYRAVNGCANTPQKIETETETTNNKQTTRAYETCTNYSPFPTSLPQSCIMSVIQVSSTSTQTNAASSTTLMLFIPPAPPSS